MLRRRFGQILIVVLGAVGLLLGLSASGAHAQGGSVSDESSASVSIQTGSAAGVSVSTQQSSTTQAGETVTSTTNNVDSASSPAGVITTESNQDSPGATSTEQTSVVDDQSKSTTASEATNSNNPVLASLGSGPKTPITQSSDAPTMVLAKSDGTTYVATKLIAHSGTSKIATPPALPAQTDPSHHAPKPVLPMLPQGYVADAPMPVASAGRDSGGPLPLVVLPFATVSFAIILSVILGCLLLISAFLSQLRAQGYARAPRGATPNIFGSLRSGFNMSSQLKLSPLFLNHKLLWSSGGEGRVQ